MAGVVDDIVERQMSAITGKPVQTDAEKLFFAQKMAEFAKLQYNRFIGEPLKSMSRVGGAMVGQNTYPIDEINDPKTVALKQAQDVLEGVGLWSGPGILSGRPSATGLSTFGGLRAKSAENPFSGSLVGKPVYHGGENVIEDFSRGAKRGEEVGVAFFTDSKDVADSYARTGTYKGSIGEKANRKGGITEAYLDIKNPVPVDAESFFNGNAKEAFDFVKSDISDADANLLEHLLETGRQKEFWKSLYDGTVKYELKDYGASNASMDDYPFLQYVASVASKSKKFKDDLFKKYDGLIFDDAESGGVTYTVFNPKQINIISKESGAIGTSLKKHFSAMDVDEIERELLK